MPVRPLGPYLRPVAPARTLIDFLRSVAAEPAEHAAFRHDPEGYLSNHGYEGIHRDDALDAMSLVADTLPPAVAARLAADGNGLDPIAPGPEPGPLARGPEPSFDDDFGMPPPSEQHHAEADFDDADDLALDDLALSHPPEPEVDMVESMNLDDLTFDGAAADGGMAALAFGAEDDDESGQPDLDIGAF